MAVGHNQALYNRYQDKGFEVLGINLWRGIDDTIAFMKERGLTYPSVLATPEVRKAYGGIRSTPTFFLLDKDGIIVKRYQGTNPAIEAELEETIASLLGLAVAKREGVEAAPGAREVAKRPLPDVPLPRVGGGVVRLSSYRGKVLVVDFWFLGSELATVTIGHFQRTYDQFRKDGLEVLGINIDSSDIPGIKAFLAERRITYPNALATGEAIDVFGGLNFIPTIVLVDQRGVIYKRYESISSATYAEIDADIVELLGLARPGERYVPGYWGDDGKWVKGHFEKVGPEGR